MKNFNELNLIAPLQRALSEEGYRTPTAIQAQTIPAALDGLDVLGCAQTGTGKTAAFALPILDTLGGERARAIPNCPLALILAPTRELAIQIGASFETYGRHLPIRTAIVFGGVSMHHQIRALDRGAQILVATPGRLLDLMNQGYIDLTRLEVFVLDEADRMLDMGFLPDLKKIIRCLPERRQSLFFSATMPSNIAQLSSQLLTDPVRVNVTPKSRRIDQIEQQVLLVTSGEKRTTLLEVLEGEGTDSVIVFTRTKRTANHVEKHLRQAGVEAAAIHGNKSQNVRQRVLEGFRNGKVRVLVATDVAARGIDVAGVTHVINFDLPTDPESYVHRIGRTGRAGAEGIAISFCTPEQISDLRPIEQLVGRQLLAPQPHESTRQEPTRRAQDQRGRGQRARGQRRPPAASGSANSADRKPQRKSPRKSRERLQRV